MSKQVSPKKSGRKSTSTLPLEQTGLFDIFNAYNSAVKKVLGDAEEIGDEEDANGHLHREPGVTRIQDPQTSTPSNPLDPLVLLRRKPQYHFLESSWPVDIMHPMRDLDSPMEVLSLMDDVLRGSQALVERVGVVSGPDLQSSRAFYHRKPDGGYEGCLLDYELSIHKTGEGGVA